MPVSEDYVLRTWDMDDGLLDNNVTAVTQTPDGYLWLATFIGLARFDGERFTSFVKENALPGLTSHRVYTVMAAHNGDVWIGLDRGSVARIHEGRVETIVAMSSPNAEKGPTTSFAEDGGGAVFFGNDTEVKITRWQNGKLTVFSGRDALGPGMRAYVYPLPDGRVGYSTDEISGFYDGNGFRRIDATGGAAVRIQGSHTGDMWEVRTGELWKYPKVGAGHLVARLDWLENMGDLSVLQEDRAGDLWIGTRNNGLFRLRNGAFVRVPTSHTDVSSMMEDTDGNLWVGTEGGGLDRLSARHFFLRQTKDGLHSDTVFSLCQDANGALWVLGRNGPPVVAQDPATHQFATPAEWPGGPALVLGPDVGGGIWIGTQDALAHWKDHVLSRTAALTGIASLIDDRIGNLWAAPLRGGLLRWRNGVSESIPAPDDLFNVRALAQDGSGAIWTGGQNGRIFRGQNEKFVPIALPGASSWQPVRFIVPDGNDTVWIGTRLGGLYRWRDGKIGRLPDNSELPVDDLRSILIEPDGDFWIGTGRGLFRASRREIDASIDGGQQPVQWTTYGLNQGLPSISFSFGYRNTTTRTRDGHLWFATDRGALEIVPGVIQKPNLTFLLIIEEARLDGALVNFSPGGGLVLAPSPGPVEIRYTLPQFSTPEQMRFRYRLVGWGRGDWVVAGNQRTATFVHLPPGDFRFEVAAARGDGPWLPATASLAITIRAAWWETPLFRGGVAASLMIGAGWVAYVVTQWRLRRRMQNLERALALDRERSRIAREIHDELGASLTRITIESQLARLDSPAAVPGHIDQISSIARETVGLMDEIVWAVNPRHDTLPALLEYMAQYAIDFVTAAGMVCEVDIPEDLRSRHIAANVRHDLFLAVKEAIHNAIKHSGGNRVWLNAEIWKDRLRVKAMDNGHGFQNIGGVRNSNGLRNMEERMAEIGGTLSVDSQSKGTCITFELPLLGGDK